MTFPSFTKFSVHGTREVEKDKRSKLEQRFAAVPPQTLWDGVSVRLEDNIFGYSFSLSPIGRGVSENYIYEVTDLGQDFD